MAKIYSFEKILKEHKTKKDQIEYNLNNVVLVDNCKSYHTFNNCFDQCNNNDIIDNIKKLRDEIYKKYGVYLIVEMTKNKKYFLEFKKENFDLKIFMVSHNIINWFLEKDNDKREFYEVYDSNLGIPHHLNIFLFQETTDKFII